MHPSIHPSLDCLLAYPLGLITCDVMHLSIEIEGQHISFACIVGQVGEGEVSGDLYVDMDDDDEDEEDDKYDDKDLDEHVNEYVDDDVSYHDQFDALIIILSYHIPIRVSAL